MTHPLFQIELPDVDRRMSVVASERADGDVHPARVEPAVLWARQRAVSGRPWLMLDQIHGVAVHHHSDLDSAGDDCGGVACVDTETMAGVADVVVSRSTDVDVAIWAADCAPIVLIGADGLVVGAHGGWRGLAAGVVDVAVEAVHRSATEVVAAVLGPVIHQCCYEFGADDLAEVAAGVGASPEEIAGQTSTGRPALDVPAAVAAALDRYGISLDTVGPCTGCDERWFSHRVNGEPGRHAVVVTIGTLA